MFCWKNKSSAVFGSCVVMLLVSCKPHIQVGALYPIDSVVTSQIVMLAGKNTVLEKEAIIDGRHDSTILKPADSTAWVDELDIFRELKTMNKPVNHSRYIVDDNLFDPGSNLTVKAFTAMDDLPVRWLRVYYENTIRKPRKIEAEYRDENALYASSRILSMNFEQIDNKTVLTSYSIDGGQKMILEDSVMFSVKGKILIH